MTPEDETLRAAWLREMWAPVHEYRAHAPQVVRKTRDVSDKPREEALECPFCQQVYSLRMFPRHLARAHSADFEEVA